MIDSKKNVAIIGAVFVLVIFFFVLLNIDTINRVGELQGKNQKIHEYKIPLYLKVLNFFDRHYNYGWVVKRITEDVEGDEEKILTLLEWTVGNIYRQPESLPVMDEHVWSVIVRRYGDIGNFNDAFSTLCNYAGINAFLKVVEAEKITTVVTLARIDQKWTVIDPANGVYFRNSKGGMASIEDMKRGDFKAVRVTNIVNWVIDYSLIPGGLPEKINFGLLGIGRANIQSPVNRFLFQLMQWIGVSG